MTNWYRKENGEIDQEKVIDELERDLVREPDEQTHIIGTFDTEAVECALSLLKAQESKKPEVITINSNGIQIGSCPCCGESVNDYHNEKFCGKCGQQLRWLG